MSFQDFLADLNLSTAPLGKGRDQSEIDLARAFLAKLNQYFFQTPRNAGTTTINEEQLALFSDFHRFWEAHHAEIIDAQVDDDRARIVAESLATAVADFGAEVLALTTSRHGMPPRIAAQVRFFTANQDFREPPEDPFGRYRKDPTWFEADRIARDPVGFIGHIDVTGQSQTDKRGDFARNAARFLVTRRIGAFDIAAYYNNDAATIRSALIHEPNMGYAEKKANMFVRDMVEWGVWPNLTNVELIDVPSDANTMKVALRTGILRTRLPLVSSFLDEFCYQYGYIAEMTALAWRTVWQHWRVANPQSAPPYPGKMDNLIYRLGKEYCKTFLVQYSCAEGHLFSYFGGGLKNCRVCLAPKRTPVEVAARMLPCQSDPGDLPRRGGVLLLDPSNLLGTFDGRCIFESACQPKRPEFQDLDPPKSISIKGRTSWTSSYADRDRGGGGMMA